MIRLDPHELISGKKITGSWGGACNPEKDLNELVRIFSKNLDVVHKISGRKYALEDINLAISDVKNRTSFRPIIKFH